MKLWEFTKQVEEAIDLAQAKHRVIAGHAAVSIDAIETTFDSRDMPYGSFLVKLIHGNLFVMHKVREIELMSVGNDYPLVAIIIDRCVYDLTKRAREDAKQKHDARATMKEVERS